MQTGRIFPLSMPSNGIDAGARVAIRVILACMATHLALHALWSVSDAHARSLLFDEDRLVETVAAILFLAAGLLSARLWMSLRDAAWADRAALGLIAVLGLIGFLDEMSFGERFFQFEVFEIAGTRIDGAHDFVEVANTLRREWMGPMEQAGKIALVVTALAAMIAAAAGVWRIAGSLRRTAPACLRLPALALGCTFLAEFGLSSLIDIRVFAFDGDQATEEVGELNMAIVLAGLAAVIGGKRRAPKAVDAASAHLYVPVR